MRYDRVDLVSEGANGHADILIAKNKTGGESAFRKPIVVRKKMGTYECGDCGTPHKSVNKSSKCSECGSKNMNYTEVEVVKKTAPATKQTPKNDDSTNAGQYTFEDEQYDQESGENGAALGNVTEQSIVNKGWFEIGKSSLTHQNDDGDGGDVDTVDNEKNEDEREGSDSDKGTELLAMTLPVGGSSDKRSGFKALSSPNKSTVGKKRTARAEKPGLNSYDLTDQGSQVVAEDAEQMYRSAHEMDPQSQEHRDSTMSDAFSKGRRKTNKEGLKILDNGTDGINAARGVRRNGTNTGSKKTTAAGRTSVKPPQNPLDKSRRIVLKKSVPSDHAVSTLEALNLGTKLAENIGIILAKGKPDLYETVMDGFLESFNAAAEEWMNGSSVTKSANADTQAEDVAKRAYAIISKAMSDDSDDDEGDDDENSDDDSGSKKLKKMKGADKVGKSLYKSGDAEGNPYEGVPVSVQKRLQRLDELEELQTQQRYDDMAAELRHLPGYNQERIAKQLRKAYEDSDDDGDYLLQTLTASANSQRDSNIYKQFGMPGDGTSANTDPMTKAYAYADSHISKSGDGPSRDQLVVEYMNQHPGEFYQEAKK
jgi:DNA-directed RNA polymerase subunit RPC12/RpoP